MALDTQGISTFLFDITLFALFCHYFKALVKQYVLPVMRDEMTGEQKRLHDLNKQKIVLSMEKDNLLEQLQEQELQFNNFEEHVKVWYQNLKKRDQEKEHALSIAQADIAYRRKIQQEYLHTRFSHTKIAPYALLSIRRKMVAMYQGEHGKCTMDTLVEALDEV